ncbi:MAG: oxidoreductase [Candidatus Bathyarchaeota archaeon]|nr:oxidoreductase [Candidatus Bathyarchaeota archaeon]
MHTSEQEYNAMDDKWTTDDMPDLTSKVIIVTGSNSGIGFEAAKEFARKGAHTILACRNRDKAQAAQNLIHASIPNANTEIMRLDLANLDSIHEFAREFHEHFTRLDVLVNNAGIMMAPYMVTVDGFENHFATNHLGHFALTGILLDVLLTTPGSRVVNVSSSGHRMGRMDFNNLMFETAGSYSPMRAYARSKRANLLFTYELHRRYNAAGIDAMAVAAHPGMSDTRLGRYLEAKWYFKILIPLMSWMMQSAAMGALPILRAAVDPNVKGCDYYGPGGFLKMRGYPVIMRSNNASYNEDDAQELWTISEQLTKVRYTQLMNS